MIGSWDNSKCIYAALPACLKLGSAPADFGYPSANIASAGPYPLYNGPAATSLLTGKLYSDTWYTSGKLKSVYAGTGAGGFYSSYELPFSTEVEWTIDLWAQCIPPVSNPALYGVAASSYYQSIPPVNSFFALIPSDYHLECYIFDGGDNFGYKASLRSGYTPDLNRVHITFVKKSDGYFEQYIDGIITDTVIDGLDLPYLGASLLGGQMRFTSQNGNNLHQAIYNEALTAEEILALHVLGPDLGGLYGYDLGGGVMRLRTAPSSNPIVESIITSSSPPVLPRIVSTSPLIGRKQDKDIYLAEEKKVYDRYKANYYRDFKSRLV